MVIRILSILKEIGRLVVLDLSLHFRMEVLNPDWIVISYAGGIIFACLIIYSSRSKTTISTICDSMEFVVRGLGFFKRSFYLGGMCMSLLV